MANYNHLHFEELLFARDSLETVERAELQAHLQTCETCRDLANAWSEVEGELQRATLLAPRDGFTARWHIREVAGEMRRRRRQNLWMLIFSVGGAALLLTLLAILFLPLLRAPLPILLVFGYQLAALFTTATATAGFVATLTRTILRVVPPTLWVGMGVAFGGMCVVWVVSLKRLVVGYRAFPAGSGGTSLDGSGL